MRPFCAVHQVKPCYDSCTRNTYESSVLTADGLLGAVSTTANTYDGDRRAANGQERADNGDGADNSQQTSEQIGVGLSSLQ